jgi:transposase
MTKDGMLQLAKSNEPSSDLSEEYPNAMVVARWVSAEGIDPADYHDTVDGEKFTAWMQNRLVPAFKRKYPGKRMVLVMDNASFHHAKGPDWYAPAEMNRGQCADFLRQINVRSIHGEVRGQERRFTSTTYSADDGPTLKLMRAEIDKWLASHPEANVEVPTQLVRDVKDGSRIIYTPPYESWLQPIELVWNQAKQQVAQGARSNRKIEETEEATKAALRGISKQACGKTINHVHKLINEWLKTSDAGWLGAYNSFDQLVDASVEERDTVYRRAMNGDSNDERTSDDQENQQEEAGASGSESGVRKRQRWSIAHSETK